MTSNAEPDGKRFRLVSTEARKPDVVTIIQPRNSLERLGLPQVWEYRHLLRLFVLRSLRGRYRPTFLGYGWILLRPTLLCLVYALVFSLLVGVDTSPIPYGPFAFLGILVFLFFAQGISETANALVSNAGMMSKVYYPRLIAPITSTLSNFLDMLAGMVIIVALMLIYQISPTRYVFLVPIFILAIAAMTFALGLLLAAYSVERRDVVIALPVAMRVFVYLIPAVYPVTLIPERFQWLFFLNPIAAFLQGLRWSLWGETAPPVWSVGLALVLTALAVLAGLRKFNKVESTMVDRL